MATLLVYGHNQQGLLDLKGVWPFDVRIKMKSSLTVLSRYLSQSLNYKILEKTALFVICDLKCY